MLSILFLVSCERKNVSSIPLAPVNIQLNLTTDYKDLKIPYRSFFFDKIEPTKNIYSVGYAGVFVYSYNNSNGLNQYAAFDMCCPYEKKKNIRVRAITNNPLFVRCEQCASTFDISSGFGFPTKGSSATEALKRYYCRRAGFHAYETLYISSQQ